MYKIKQNIKNNLVILLYFYLFLSSSISYSIVYNYLWKTNKILEPSWITAHNKYGVKEQPSWVTVFKIAIFVFYWVEMTDCEQNNPGYFVENQFQ